MQLGMVAATIISRMAVWGLVGGAGLGSLYGMIVFALATNSSPASLGCVGSFIFGGLVGGPLGLLTGLVLAVLTQIALRSRMRVLHYRQLMYSVIALLTGSGALFGFSWFYPPPQDMSVDWGWISYALVPALIAVVVAVVATVRITRWVESSTTLSANVE